MDGKISNLQQIVTLRRYTVTDGADKGLDVIDCDNGKIRFLINVSKACDIMQLYHEGQNVSFVSKNGFTNRQTSFENCFEGGMLYTCGLDSLGRREGYPTHGTFHHIPAQIISAKCDENGIEVEAIIRDTALFGKNLVVRRRICASVLSERVVVEDVLCNEGFSDEKYCLLYHCNIGYPMLDADAEILLDAKRIDARSDWAKENRERALVVENCTPNMEETCYYLALNKPSALLVNKKIKKEVEITYSHETLPCFVEWKSMASGDYALGFEPSTTELGDAFAYTTIKSQEKVTFRIEICVRKIAVS